MAVGEPFSVGHAGHPPARRHLSRRDQASSVVPERRDAGASTTTHTVPELARTAPSSATTCLLLAPGARPVADLRSRPTPFLAAEDEPDGAVGGLLARPRGGLVAQRRAFVVPPGVNVAAARLRARAADRARPMRAMGLDGVTITPRHAGGASRSTLFGTAAQRRRRGHPCKRRWGGRVRGLGAGRRPRPRAAGTVEASANGRTLDAQRGRRAGGSSTVPRIRRGAEETKNGFIPIDGHARVTAPRTSTRRATAPRSPSAGRHRHPAGGRRRRGHRRARRCAGHAPAVPARAARAPADRRRIRRSCAATRPTGTARPRRGGALVAADQGGGPLPRALAPWSASRGGRARRRSARSTSRCRWSTTCPTRRAEGTRNPDTQFAPTTAAVRRASLPAVSERVADDLRAVDIPLRDRRSVRVRPIRPDDEGPLLAFLESMAPSVRYLRFFSGGVEPGGGGRAGGRRRRPRPLRARRRRPRTTAHPRPRLRVRSAPGAAGRGRVRRRRRAAGRGHRDDDARPSRRGGRAPAGIERFVADVLPANHRMLDVFRESGFARRPCARSPTR